MSAEAVAAVLAAVDTGVVPGDEGLRSAVKWLVAELARRAPGHSVEVRVPPYAAVQCIAGPKHTRGTPSNVVETDPVTWVLLATGRLPWADAMADGRLRTSGQRANLRALLPLVDVS
jgi:hypothetical protein